MKENEVKSIVAEMVAGDQTPLLIQMITDAIDHEAEKRAPWKSPVDLDYNTPEYEAAAREWASWKFLGTSLEHAKSDIERKIRHRYMTQDAIDAEYAQMEIDRKRRELDQAEKRLVTLRPDSAKTSER